MVTATNQERTSRGLTALTTQACVNQYANTHAARMASEKRMYHQELGPILSACKLNGVGENVAYGYTSGTAVTAGWMGSTGHRQNILNPELPATRGRCGPGFRTVAGTPRRSSARNASAEPRMGRHWWHDSGSTRRPARPPVRLRRPGRTRGRWCGSLSADRRSRGWLVAEVNGEPAAASPLARYFVEAGFAVTSGGLQLRVPRIHTRCRCLRATATPGHLWGPGAWPGARSLKIKRHMKPRQPRRRNRRRRQPRGPVGPLLVGLLIAGRDVRVEQVVEIDADVVRRPIRRRIFANRMSTRSMRSSV